VIADLKENPVFPDTIFKVLLVLMDCPEKMDILESPEKSVMPVLLVKKVSLVKE